MKNFFLPLIFFVLILPLGIQAQTTVFTESFTGTNNTLTTSGNPSVTYSSNLGLSAATAGSASIQINALQISNGNNATASSNSNGLGYVAGTSTFSSPYNTTLASNTDKVAWFVNFSNTRTGAVLSTSMTSGNYTQAVILACDNADPRTAGAKGYGLFLLRSATDATKNALYLIYFTNGINGVANSGTTNQTIIQTTPDLYASGVGGTRYISAKTTYDPATGTWQLSYRNEATAYTIATNETSGYNTLTGVVNNTGTSISMPKFGFAWGYGTTTGNNATFDNFEVRIVPPPVVPTISVTKSTLTGYVYVTGAGPSTAQTVQVSGLNLGTTPISISAPTDYEVNNPAVNTTYGNSLSLTPSSGTVTATTINVRLKAGLPAANYNGEVINLSSTTASQTITCSGLVKNLTMPATQFLPYTQDFSGLTGSTTTAPTGWQAWEVSANTPSSAGRITSPDKDSDFSAGTAASTGSGAYDFNGKIGFLSSATSDVALALAVNTTGKYNVEVGFDAMTIRNLYNVSLNNLYIEGIILQYRVGTSSAFTTLSYLPSTYIQNQIEQLTGTTGQNIIAGNIATLPPACNNQSVVQIRWILKATGSGDVKQSFALDNVFVRESLISPKADYYVDATSGNDDNDGSQSMPWQSISKVNTLIFSAGSRIFFKSGEIWSGQLIPKGLGTTAEPTIIGKYGTGASPIINGIGITGKATVYLENQQYWEINDLEITNYPGALADFDASTGGDRRGVFVAIYGFGTANHIYLKNLNIHHVRGQDGSGSTTVNGAIPKRTGGVYFAVLDTEGANDKSRFNDILIDGCTIAYCDNTGLSFDNEWGVFYPGGQNSSNPADVTEYNNWYDRRNTNLLIKNNTIHHIAKNAMIIRMADETGLIEHNVCYETAIKTTGNTMFTARCKGTVFQYNEGYLNRATTTTGGTIDGSMYDSDFGSVGIIFQYSYSHDNSQGLYWGCNARSQTEVNSGIPDPNDVGTTVRYNISQNDLGDLIFFNYPSAGNEVYNNTFYIGAGLSPVIIHENSRTNHTYNFYNNIIYNLSDETTGARYRFGTGAGIQTRTISNNVYFGSHPTGEPTDPFKIVTDPQFVNPGVGTIGLGTVNGYRLKGTSTAINGGAVIANNGGKDFWGNPLYKNAPDIGAHETNAPTLTSVNLCTAGSTNLQANCGGSDVPQWYNALEGGSSLTAGNSYTTPTISTNTTYYVSCKSSVNNVENAPRSPINVTISLPTASVSGGGTVCAGATLPNVSVALTGTAPWSITYTDATTPTTITGITTSPYTIAAASVGTYTVTAVSDVNCMGTSMTGSASVVVNPNPTATASSNSPVCAGTILNLTSSGGSTYTWTGSDSYSSSSQNPSVSTATSGTYQVKVTDANGCSATASVAVVVNPNPNKPIAQGNVVISTGSNLTLTATGCQGAIGIYQLKWYEASDNQSVTMPITPTTTTTYYAVCEQTLNTITCVSEKSNNVIVTVGSIVISIKSGNWEDASTWDVGRVPNANDNVIVDTPHAVNLNSIGSAKTVTQKGNLIFVQTNSNLKLGF